MRAGLVLLVLLGINAASVRAAAPPPREARPLPAGTSDPGKPYFTAVHLLGPAVGFWYGCGWQFPDGSTLEARWRHPGGPVQLGYRWFFYEEERFRWSAVGGTECGLRTEWYLGNGFCARLDAGVELLTDTSPVLYHLAVDWYASDRLCLTIGYELTRGWSWGWRMSS